MSWNNTPVFPINPEGFAWPIASSETFLPSSIHSSSQISPLATRTSFIATATGSRSFSTVSFPMTKESLAAAAPSSSDFSQHSMLESDILYTSSIVDGTSSVPPAILTSSQYTTDVSYYPTATTLSTGKNILAN